jgi:hypothetical protein
VTGSPARTVRQVPDQTLGQVAYERYAALFAGNRTLLAWDALRPPVRARWETVATAVLEACGGQ